MNTLILASINFVMLAVLFFGLYLIGRIFIPILAEKETFFSAPKLGRGKARKRGGRIVSFFDNFVGKNKHVNTETGLIEEGEIKKRSFWWTLFGVVFIGLDEIYTYNIATEAIENSEGQMTYTEKEASSIFLDGSYPLTAIFITREGVRLRMKLQLKLTTLDMAKALSLPISWTIPVFVAVLGASRDFFGTRSIHTLISTHNEGRENNIDLSETKHSDFIRRILSLNNPATGNVTLAEICGQRIDAVNIIDIDFADADARKAFSSPFVSEQEAQRQVKEAEAYARSIRIRSEADKEAATDIAKATTLRGEAEANVYSKKRKGLGGDTRAAAMVMIAEKQSEMDNLTTLVNGGGSILSIPTEDKKEVPKTKR